MIRVIPEGLRLVGEMGVKERLNVETSEGLNVEKQNRAELCGKKKDSEDRIRHFETQCEHFEA